MKENKESWWTGVLSSCAFLRVSSCAFLRVSSCAFLLIACASTPPPPPPPPALVSADPRHYARWYYEAYYDMPYDEIQEDWFYYTYFPLWEAGDEDFEWEEKGLF